MYSGEALRIPVRINDRAAWPSLCANNGQLWQKKMVYVADKEICICDFTGAEKFAKGLSPTKNLAGGGKIVTQRQLRTVQVLSWQGYDFFIAAGLGGMEIYDATERQKIFSWSLPPSEEGKAGVLPFMQCSDLIEEEENRFLVIGTSYGTLQYFKVDKFKFVADKSVRVFERDAVTCVRASNGVLFAGSVLGHAAAIIGGTVAWSMPVASFPINCTVCLPEHVALGCGNGQIVFVDRNSGRKVVEVDAHARVLSGMTSCRGAENFLATCGQDGAVNVFDCSLIKSGKIRAVFSSLVPNLICTGISSDAQRLAVIGYDSESIYVWPKL